MKICDFNCTKLTDRNPAEEIALSLNVISMSLMENFTIQICTNHEKIQLLTVFNHSH